MNDTFGKGTKERKELEIKTRSLCNEINKLGDEIYVLQCKCKDNKDWQNMVCTNKLVKERPLKESIPKTTRKEYIPLLEEGLQQNKILYAFWESEYNKVKKVLTNGEIENEQKTEQDARTRIFLNECWEKAARIEM